jgi:rhamnosyl/mannosyltransferase
VSLDGVTGLTVAPKDAGALARGLNSLLSDPELRLRYGRQARRRVEEEFSRELMLRRTLEVYVQVIAQPDKNLFSQGVEEPSAVFALARTANTT